jgi:hypothetical protein
MNKKILICGDSFSSLHDDEFAWTNLIKQDFFVTNLSQRGCSEYKIYKQILSQNIHTYDYVIISHTSPYRLHTLENPIHINNPLYKDSCFIYSDVKKHATKNTNISPLVNFFEKYFDLDYAEYIHNLILKDIEKLCPVNTLHISHLEWKNLHRFSNHLDFNNVFLSHRGQTNHYDIKGNKIVYETIREKLT